MRISLLPWPEIEARIAAGMVKRKSADYYGNRRGVVRGIRLRRRLVAKELLAKLQGARYIHNRETRDNPRGVWTFCPIPTEG
jgi:hypothetical protein